MKEAADDVFIITDGPKYGTNTYYSAGILFDTGSRFWRSRLIAALGNRPVGTIALTHCHPDHKGCAKAMAEHFGAAVVCHDVEAEYVEGSLPVVPGNPIVRSLTWLAGGPPCPVTRRVVDGDFVGDWRVVFAPGHTHDHVIFFRDSDRVAIAGDVVAGRNPFTKRPVVWAPWRGFTADTALYPSSVRQLAELRPSLTLVGHGPPIRRFDDIAALATRLGA